MADKPFDPTLKAMVETEPVSWPVFFGRAAAPTTVIDADIATVSGAADKVLHVAGEPPYLLHLEFVAGHDAAVLPRKVHLRNALLEDRHDLRVRSGIVLLRPEADSPQVSGLYERGFPGEASYLLFRYQVVRVWQLAPEPLLRGGLGVLPLALISAVTEADLPGIIGEIRQRLASRRAQKQTQTVWAAAYILLGLRFSPALAEQLFRGVVSMRESSTYQAILEEGRLEGQQKGRAEGRAEGRTEGAVQEARKLLRLVGDDAFGPPDARTATAIEQIDDLKRLEELCKSCRTAASWRELLAGALPVAAIRAMSHSYLGIEIGGTKLQLGIGPGDGTLAAMWRETVDVAAGGEGIRRQIKTAVPELLQRAGLPRSAIQGVGIGFGGPVDDATRTVIKSHQIAGWDDFPLAAWIEELLGWPVALGNDADVAGLAEALFGAGAGLSPVFYITIGSGIGGGLILQGQIHRGCGRGAAEIGHLLIRQGPDRELIPLEHLASGWAIGRQARGCRAEFRVRFPPLPACVGTARTNHRRSRGPGRRCRRPPGGSGPGTGLGLPGRGHRAGDRALGPRRIVIGGGVSLMGEPVLFEPLRDKVRQIVFKPFLGRYDIVPAALGEEVVVHGALVCAGAA